MDTSREAGRVVFEVTAGRTHGLTMTDLSIDDVHSRTITALFDAKGTAQKATDDLIAAGVPREHIRLTEGSTSASETVETEHKGFWDELKDLFLPDEDRYGYAEGLQRGGYLLAVRVDEANYTRALDILDTDGAVDMNEREANWRTEGWTGYQAGQVPSARTAAATNMGLAANANKGTAALSSAPAAARPAATAAPVDTLQAGRDAVIPIYEETAQIGKRDVNHGRVRLRSYVVETPISEQVNLRNEQVQVERRPVDRAISATDAVFENRVIEAEEHVEEAVVTKEARVKEEISLRKTVENQSQTVSDTVRRTEVEVDDSRGGRAVAGAQTALGSVNTSSIVAHMDVIGSDGVKIGTVDHLDGPENIKLAKNTSPDGQHHYVPLNWVDHVDAHVHLNKTSADAKAAW